MLDRMWPQNGAQHNAYSMRPDVNVGTSGTMQHAQMLNDNMGAGGAQLPMSGVVPLAEPPPKRQKTVNLQVGMADVDNNAQNLRWYFTWRCALDLDQNICHTYCCIRSEAHADHLLSHICRRMLAHHCWRPSRSRRSRRTWHRWQSTRRSAAVLHHHAHSQLLSAFAHVHVCIDCALCMPHCRPASLTSVVDTEQQVAAGGKAKSMFEFADDSVCLACSQNRLTFEPPSLYCTCCGQRIKRNQVCADARLDETLSATCCQYPVWQTCRVLW